MSPYTGGIYDKISLNKNTTCSIHRLVAIHFIDNPYLDLTFDDLEPNHKNGNKKDNRFSNLEWLTHQENIEHSNKNIKTLYTRSVVSFNPDGTEHKRYKHIKDVVEDGFQKTHISACCSGRRKTHGGYTWKYTEDVDSELEIILIDEPVEWRATKDSIYPDLNQFPNYEVSNTGQVRHIRNRNKTLKLQTANNRYIMVELNHNKIRKTFPLHRLLIMVFNVPNPENKPEVDHIDSNTFNNDLSNLRWATVAENRKNPNTHEKIRKNKISKKAK